ncbi:4-phytase / acid phosphatase [Rhizobium sp. RU35A]|uniref:Histidine-type phosphatase n=1 Tax=Rhizobium straminoryzae TaxID=1387186 RepID=A0A549TI66_9HYPH|nr:MULTISPECIES: histidine-type phosphatase [Rhizobium]TRL42940.1 hypothetical protein FNA46_00550 [Rhizobium straminoryzae]SIQ03597.1 4-phytase / acid phosphatase [Rhizobium sp. RU35A]
MSRATLLLAACLALFDGGVASAANFTVDKHVSIMRHGVRPPTNSRKLAIYQRNDWPFWDVADGMLTTHGAAVTQRLATWQVAMLRQKGLVPTEGCPTAGNVFAWGNGAVQRTLDTGNVLLENMFPGCGLTVGHNETKYIDPLYDTASTPYGAVDPEKASKAILEAAGGDLNALKAKAEPLMKELDAITECEGKSNPCSMVNRPWTIDVAPAKGAIPAIVSVKGPIADAGTLVELFMLEYANGFPMRQVAFGKLKGADDIIRLSALRQMKYDIGNRVPYLAARDASSFFNQVLLSLAQEPGKRSDDQPGPPNARFVLFMASDTQQAEVAAMLGIHWHIPPYLDDETPPNGALTFERLHDDKGRAYVRLGFTAPTLDQIRSASHLNAASPPVQADIAVPGCESESINGACPLDRFLQIARATLDMDAVIDQDYRPPIR